MGKTIRQKLKETKSELVLNAVSDYFDRVGFDRPTMQEIAKAVGISVGALYKLFPSKEALYFAYIDHQIRRFHQELLQKSAAAESPRERLLLYIRLKFAAFASKRKALEDPVLGDPLFFVKMNTRKENPAQPIFHFLAEQFSLLHRSLPLRSEDHLQTAYLFNGYTMGQIEYWLNVGGELESKAEEVFESFLQGIVR
ncbi:TetR/AcrR family transcriptional regulator [Nitratifractor sp.]